MGSRIGALDRRHGKTALISANGTDRPELAAAVSPVEGSVDAGEGDDESRANHADRRGSVASRRSGRDGGALVLPGGVGWHGAFELLLWATTALFAATALVWVVHSMDTVAGVLDPPGDFRVTEKAGGE